MTGKANKEMAPSARMAALVDSGRPSGHHLGRLANDMCEAAEAISLASEARAVKKPDSTSPQVRHAIYFVEFIEFMTGGKPGDLKRPVL